jgi:hypothetical protein
MAGLLLYTAAPDSEGTLGGLVSSGEPDKLGRMITLALEQIRLCASDPLCKVDSLVAALRDAAIRGVRISFILRTRMRARGRSA